MSKVKYGVNSTVLVLVVAGILIAINVIGSRVFTRLDLTEGKEFTISDATKGILHRLDDVVNCKVYMSGKLPDQITTLEQTVEDILKEYEVYSDGKLRVQYIDPTDDEDAKGAAQAAGIPQLQVNVYEQDQYQIQNVYLGAAIEYGGKTETIPVLDTNTLEYDMSSAIVKLTMDEKPYIGFLQGHGEKVVYQDLKTLPQLLQDRYSVRPVDLSGGSVPVPANIDVLVIGGAEGITEREKYEIDQFVMRGGRLVVLDNVVSLIETDGLSAQPRESGIRDLVAFYGCEIEPALVMEHPRYSGQARFSQGFLSYIVPYPLWPKGAPGLLNPNNPITAQLESTLMPFTAPLRLHVPGDEDAELDREKAEDEGLPTPSNPNLGKDQPDVEGVVLVRTTERAWIQSGSYDLDPQSPAMQQPPATGESYPLVVGLTGKFRSFFANRPIPVAPGSDGASMAAADSTITESVETQMLIAGNSNFITDQFLGMHPENSLLIQNALDWMTLGNDLIAIRSRGATARPFEHELSNGQKAAIKYANTFGIAGLVVLLGLVWNAARRRSRQQLRDRYTV
ncbi:MAG: Gldg family protein [Candidatus Eisenbacteria bacterium]